LVSKPLPRARPLEPIPAEVQGQQVIVLRDPVGFSNDVVISPFVYFFLAHCDGERTLEDVKLVFARQFQHILTEEESDTILRQLDEHLLLDTERFALHRNSVIQTYREQTVRPAVHLGGAYAAEPAALRAELDSYYTHPDGPGTPPADTQPGDQQLRGLIAPHISVSQGGTCFAWAYHRLRRSQPIRTFVILGTGHAEIEGCFAATRKSFETPLGQVAVDGDLVDRLERYFGGDLCAREIHHRTEHVIEFQLIFLQHALAGRGDFRIVPILCSFGPESLADGADSAETRSVVDRFCDALRRSIAESTEPVCVICSADLAHIGYRYGDAIEIGPLEITRLEREDREMIDVLCRGDAQGFLDNLLADGNRRHICGFPCVYPMLRALDLGDGELLRYAQSAMDARNSTVSYASVAFYETVPDNGPPPTDGGRLHS
jgi:AmmeMemoRadiSam system protein B